MYLFVLDAQFCCFCVNTTNENVAVSSLTRGAMFIMFAI